MLGPLLAMPSGQGQSMSFLAILKSNQANRLLVLEIKLELGKKVSTIDKVSLLARQHYYIIMGFKWLRLAVENGFLLSPKVAMFGLPRIFR
jgi:hypothetical protein